MARAVSANGWPIASLVPEPIPPSHSRETACFTLLTALTEHFMSNGKVLIGNWQEELAYERDRRHLLQKQKAGQAAAGATLGQQILAKVKAHKAPVPLTPLAADGLLHLGAAVVIQNAGTDGLLSTDLDDSATIGYMTKFAVTTAKASGPMARNVFVLENDGAAPDDIIRYGQRLRIRAHPALSMPAGAAAAAPDVASSPLYLASMLKSPVSFSKVSRNHEVFLVQDSGSITNWIFQYANPEFRLEMEGQPVKANALVVLLHVNTNAPLASTVADHYTNDFGVECETCCHRYFAKQVRGGKAPELPANLWALVTAPAPAPTEAAQ
mgnify:FL=1